MGHKVNAAQKRQVHVSNGVICSGISAFCMKYWPLNTGDWLIQVALQVGLTVKYISAQWTLE